LEQEVNEKDKQIHKLVVANHKPGGKGDGKTFPSAESQQQLQRLETQIKFKTDDLHRAEEKAQKLEAKLEQLEADRARLVQDRTRLEKELARQADQVIQQQQKHQLLQQQMLQHEEQQQQQLLQERQEQKQSKAIM
jgi:hypothetical protein